MLVRISDTGFMILDDRELANKVLFAIINGKENFEHGKPVVVEGANVSVEMVTSIKEEAINASDKKVKVITE